MGKRGSSSGMNAGSGSKIPQLDKDLVEKANAAGMFVDYGDSAQRAYDRQVAEIQTMDLTDDEKTAAINRLHELTTAQLEAESKSLSPYSMGVGPARFNAEKMRQANDKAIKAKSQTDAYMDNLRTAQGMKKERAERQRTTEEIGKAQQSGKLEVTVGGKSYFRTSKSSSTWREGTIRDYKAEQRYKKSLKNLPFSQHRAWSSLSDAEKQRFYK